MTHQLLFYTQNWGEYYTFLFVHWRKGTKLRDILDAQFVKWPKYSDEFTIKSFNLMMGEYFKWQDAKRTKVLRKTNT